VNVVVQGSRGSILLTARAHALLCDMQGWALAGSIADAKVEQLLRQQAKEPLSQLAPCVPKLFAVVCSPPPLYVRVPSPSRSPPIAHKLFAYRAALLPAAAQEAEILHF
jgi:hypothetical protein